MVSNKVRERITTSLIVAINWMVRLRLLVAVLCPSLHHFSGYLSDRFTRNTVEKLFHYNLVAEKRS